jgi:uncharacterized protein YlxP (DUF503 family)
MCRVSLRLPGNQGLKGKRQVAQSLISRVRRKFNVAIAEVDDNELWQRLTLGVTCVSNDGRHANEILSKVVQYIEETRGDVELLDYQAELVSGI